MTKHIDNTVMVLDDVEHILTVPSRYIGSVSMTSRNEFILGDDGNFIQKEFSIVPAFITLLREVISNSIDEYVRTNGDYANKIDIKFDGKYFEVKDNGRGISHTAAVDKEGKEVGLPQSVVAFTKTKSGTNFKDKTASIGQNGEGVSLVNIFSKHFNAETADGIKKTTIECRNNLSKQKYKIVRCKKQFTKIKWLPDYQRLNLASDNLGDDCIRYIKKIILDMSVCYLGIKFTFNRKTISSKSFKSYAKRYGGTFESFSYDNVDVAVFPSSDFQQVSWVNGIYTRRGGFHLDMVTKGTIAQLRLLLHTKYKEIKPVDIKNKLFFVVSVRNMKAPRFDSQTKEELINTNKDFETDLFNDVPFDKIAKKIKSNKDIMDNIIETFKIKEELKKKKELDKTQKKLKSKSIPKLIESYSRDRRSCRLYISEGKSATMNFLSTREKDYAAYPLKGKFVNCYVTSREKLLKNAEVSDILAATGLKLTSPSIKNLRYGKIVIFTDADYDGDAICCLLINFFYKFWPDLIKEGRLYRAITPLISAKNLDTNRTKRFFSLDDFNEASKGGNWKMVDYNKGLGSLSKKEYKFSLDNLSKILYDEKSEESLKVAFGKDANLRKEWLMK